MSVIVFVTFIGVIMNGCAEKRLPVDELVRDFLYEYRGRQPSSLSPGSEAQDKYYRKYMRIAEMNEDDYLKVAIPVGIVSVKDPKFFSNNLDGRKEMDEISSLSQSDRDIRVKEICQLAFRDLKDIGERREELRRSSEGGRRTRLSTNETNGKRSADNSRLHVETVN
jgi:hypothetical protein